ncbi:MAG: CoB--CoM heterodisulfide reductase iron-sulfur subunit B family protein [Carboxydocellales bacterium]
MKYAYYPGCSLHATAAEFDSSTKAVCNQLGVELQEIPDWNCCGASSAHNSSHFLASAIPGRNLILAEQMGLDVASPCAACYQRLKVADHHLKHDDKLRNKMTEITGHNYQGQYQVKNIVDVIVDNFDISKATKTLNKLKVVCYYGCLMVRPGKLTGIDNTENPQTMDNILEELGAEVIQWPYKAECCGGSSPLYDAELALKLIRDILKVAKDSGAQAIVTACPLCMSNLDMRQVAVEKKYGESFKLPILYFTELVGLALGIPAQKLGLTDKHFVEPMECLRSQKVI